jgi:hypothetical protein
LSLGKETRIVWVAGGVPAGAWSDLTLARDKVVTLIADDEFILADRGYNDVRYFMLPRAGADDAFNRRHKAIMARHESINSRFKTFGCLRDMFRHDREYHRECVFAIANVINSGLIEDPSSFAPFPTFDE